MELRDVMMTTPAVREFTDEPVDDSVVRSILDVARFAPSGGNRQGWRIIVLQSPEVRRRVRDLFVPGMREYVAHMRAGLVPFAPGPDGRWSGPAIDLDEARSTTDPMPFADHLDAVPVLLLLVVDLTSLAIMDNGLDRQSIIGGASVYPFAHNILLAARDVGLGGVLTTMVAREEPAMKELLDIPDRYAIAGMLAIGHPVRQITRLRRAPVDAFTTVDRFDGPTFG